MEDELDRLEALIRRLHADDEFRNEAFKRFTKHGYALIDVEFWRPKVVINGSYGGSFTSPSNPIEPLADAGSGGVSEAPDPDATAVIDFGTDTQVLDVLDVDTTKRELKYEYWHIHESVGNTAYPNFHGDPGTVRHNDADDLVPLDVVIFGRFPDQHNPDCPSLDHKHKYACTCPFNIVGPR